MKKVIIAGLCVTIGLFAISAINPIEFKLTEKEGGELFQAIEISKKAISTSSGITAAEGTATIKVLSDIQKSLAEQYQKQNPKSKPDSIKPKK